MASNHSYQPYCCSGRANSVRITSLFPLVRRRFAVNARLMDPETAEINATGVWIRYSERVWPVLLPCIVLNDDILKP